MSTMAILSLNLNYISSVEDSIRNAIGELDRRQSDYEGICTKVSNIQSSSGNLSTCNTYLKKKNERLQENMDKLTSFQNRVNTFASNAKAADSRVATYVTDESNTFYKTVGIKTGWQVDLEGILEGCSDIWECVVNIYEEHKYVIDFIVDAGLVFVAVVALVAAIPTGGATAFFAGFALAQAVGDLTTSTVALGCHMVGDDEQAEIWADRGLRDLVQVAGGAVDWTIGAALGIHTNTFRNLTGFAYDVVSAVSIGYAFYDAGGAIHKALTNKNFRRVRFDGIKVVFGLNLTPGESKEGYKALVNTFGFIHDSKQAYNVVRGCAYFENIQTTCEIIHSIYTESFLPDGMKVLSDIKSAWESLNSADQFLLSPYSYTGALGT